MSYPARAEGLVNRISDVLLWTLSNRRAKVGRAARTYLQQLCADVGCCLEDLLGAMDDRDRWSGKSVLAAQHDDGDDI